MFPTSAMRVPVSTSEEVNEEIRRRMKARIAEAAEGGPGAIEARLEELDGEWDVERVLEANAATVGLIGLGLGTAVDRRFLAVPAVVAGFLLMHAMFGWCPPLPILRRMGFRTMAEIDEERAALKAMRGDFHDVTPAGDPRDRARRAPRAVRR